MTVNDSSITNDRPMSPGAPDTAPGGARRNPPLFVVRAGSGWRVWELLNLTELWHYRDLLWMLALRDIQVRYKQTLIGAAWAVLQPLATMAIFYVLFALLNARPVSEGVPYVLSAYAGLVLWQLFSTSLSHSSLSLVENQALVKKVYCPRLVFPMAPIIASLLDFAVAFGLLVLMLVWYGFVPGWTLLALPLPVFLAMTTALAVSLWLAALCAMYRDFQFVIPFLTQSWLYVTPVLYESGIVIPAKWRALYFLNPMAGVVEGFRWVLFGRISVPAGSLTISLITVAGVLVTGLIYFRHCEDTLADWV
ncbi:MAG: ABC transporter permease [Thermoguttaceae bacterium]